MAWSAGLGTDVILAGWEQLGGPPCLPAYIFQRAHPLNFRARGSSSHRNGKGQQYNHAGCERDPNTPGAHHRRYYPQTHALFLRPASKMPAIVTMRTIAQCILQ